MNQFSISQLSQFSGIKPHTIRMWEQRYKALTPNRTEGNTRYYDNSQLRRLLNLVSLSAGNYKISELAVMPDKKLFKLVEELQAKRDSNPINEYFISQLIAAGMSYDDHRFDKIFSHCLLRYGMKGIYLAVVYPVLVRVGILWAGNMLPPAHEHFISNLFRQKLYTAIDSLPPAKTDSDSWLLFLPENEFHEIGLLFAYYLIRLRGKKVIYLGSNIPEQSLAEAVKSTSARNLLLFLVHNDSGAAIQEYLNGLSSRFADKNIFVAANHFNLKIKTQKEIYWLRSVEDLEQKLSAEVV